MEAVVSRLTAELTALGRNSEHYVKYSEDFEVFFALNDLQPLHHNTQAAQTAET